jgi:uncharacterized protein YecE (DUF72 family)
MGYGIQIGQRMMQRSQLKRMLNLLKMIIMVMVDRVGVTTGNIIPQTQTTVVHLLHRVHKKDLDYRRNTNRASLERVSKNIRFHLA